MCLPSKKSTLKVIRFEIHRPGGGDVDQLPKGVKGNPSLMMWKELCRTGNYETDGVEHKIDVAFLQHIVEVFRKRQRKGIEVPCPIGHTHDPEKKRGKVLYLELRKQTPKEASLYGIIEFINEDAKEQLQHSDVSIDAPEQIFDGDGECHESALDHVAFTDYPVVAGMEKFKDIRFSIVTHTTGGKKMARRRRFENTDDDLKKDEKEFENEELEKEEEEEKKELARKRKLSRKKKFEKEEDDEEDTEFDDGTDDSDDEDVEYSDDEEEDLECSEEDEEDEKTLSRRKKFGKKGKKFSRNSASFSLLRENRTLKIQGMLRDGKITPAQSRLMKSLYCSDSSIQFSLNNNTNRDFQNACRLLESGVGADFTEKTGVQFGNFRNPGGNVLDRVIQAKFQSRK